MPPPNNGVSAEKEWERAGPIGGYDVKKGTPAMNAAENPELGWEPSRADYRSPKIPTIDPLKLEGVDIPARKWIVNGWIPHGNVTMLGGDGGTGKSLISMQLLTACAIGRPWLGQPTMACRAMGVFCEDDVDELHRRQDAINKHYGVTFADLENLKWISRVGEDSVMMTFDRQDRGSATEFYYQILREAQDFGAQLIVLDALHDLFGGNENFRPQARKFTNLLRSFARDQDGGVLVNAHPSLTGIATKSGMSGSTAWSNAVRSRLYLTRPETDEGVKPDELERVLTRKKANYASADDSIEMTWRDGVFAHAVPAQGILDGMEKRNAQSAFLDGLDALARSGQYLSDNPRSGNYAPRLIKQTPHGKRIKQAEFVGAMQRLLSDGEIKIEDYKKAGKTHSRIVRAEETKDAQ